MILFIVGILVIVAADFAVPYIGLIIGKFLAGLGLMLVIVSIMTAIVQLEDTEEEIEELPQSVFESPPPEKRVDWVSEYIKELNNDRDNHNM